jgi:anthranilate phosphoribosyltransferase
MSEPILRPGGAEQAAPPPPEPPSLAALLIRLGRHGSLGAADAEAAFTEVMQGRATPVQIAALLVALRIKGETAEEVAGGVRALRSAMIPVASDASAGPLVDTCGTGGGGLTTFNISTAAALLAAAAGARIAKHGNRSFTSRCGSADVLDALGVPIEMTPAQMAAVLAEAGIVFMFAPLLHPAMRHVGPIRRELGFPTVMNLLGPLTNPAGARRQVVGVADPDVLELVAGALRELSHEHALVIHGAPGLDELSPLGVTTGFEVRGPTLRPFRLDPADLFGSTPFDPTDLAGGDPADNARLVNAVLRGETGGAARAAVTLNAGAALYLAGATPDLAAGVQRAEATLDAGDGMAALERLRAATDRAMAAH